MPRDRVLALIDRIRASRIVVVGDLILDRYLIGDTERLSPEAPVPVVTVREHRAALGGAANVAANVAAIGATCRTVGVVGDDLEGTAFRTEMATQRLPDQFVLTVAAGPPRRRRGWSPAGSRWSASMKRWTRCSMGRIWRGSPR